VLKLNTLIITNSFYEGPVLSRSITALFKFLPEYATHQTAGIIGLAFIGRAIRHGLHDEAWSAIGSDPCQSAINTAIGMKRIDTECSLEATDIVFWCTPVGSSVKPVTNSHYDRAADMTDVRSVTPHLSNI
jgi:hypothetical protein